MTALTDSLRFLRYMYSAVLVIIVLVALAGETLLPSRPSEPPAAVNVLYALAAGDVFLALYFRRKFSGAALENLRANPTDAAALADWCKGQLLPLPMALSVGFMGLACRFLGAPVVRTAPLYVAALIVLMVLRPTDPQV